MMSNNIYPLNSVTYFKSMSLQFLKATSNDATSTQELESRTATTQEQEISTSRSSIKLLFSYTSNDDKSSSISSTMPDTNDSDVSKINTHSVHYLLKIVKHLSHIPTIKKIAHIESVNID